MSEYNEESLSALLDGEVDDLELRRLLKSVEAEQEQEQEESELTARWQRYHLAQDILHDRGIPVSAGLAKGVSQAIAHEPAPSAKSATNSGFSVWQQQLGRVAIAACVALVAVFALQPDTSNPGATIVVQETTADAPAQAGSAPAAILVADSTEAAVDAAAQQRLREYIGAMQFDPAEPVHIEHLQDSPLYRLVNEYQAKP